MSINSQSLKHHPSGRLVSSVVNSTTPAALANLIAESENNTGHDGLTQIEAIMPSKDNQSYKKEVAMPSRAASVDGLLDGRTTKTNGHPASGNQAREQNFSYADGIPRSGGHVTDHDLRTPQSSPGHYNRAGTKHDSASTPHKTSVPHSPESIDLHGLEGTELDTLANKLGSVDLDGDTKSQGFLRGLSATKSSGQSFSSDGDLTRFVSAENVSKVFLAAQWVSIYCFSTPLVLVTDTFYSKQYKSRHEPSTVRFHRTIQLLFGSTWTTFVMLSLSKIIGLDSIRSAQLDS